MDTPDIPRKGKDESEVTATVAVATFAELVDRAAITGARIVVTTHGKRRAAIIGIDDFELLRAIA